MVQEQKNKASQETHRLYGWWPPRLPSQSSPTALPALLTTWIRCSPPNRKKSADNTLFVAKRAALQRATFGTQLRQNNGMLGCALQATALHRLFSN